MIAPPAHIHLIGIGGAGMSAIARVLLGRGYVVSGSDRAAGPLTEALAGEGARVFVEHAADQITGAEIIVRSSAIPDSNPEVAAGIAAGIPILKRFDFLGGLMSESCGIAIAGTHGKTTTTGLIGHLLFEADRDPTLIVGGILPLIKSNGRAGQSRYFVIEADEYDRMFLGLEPEIGIITNVEHDHPDIFETEAIYFDAFLQFIEKLPENGTCIVCLDDIGVRQLLGQLIQKQPDHGYQIIGYGLGDMPDLEWLAAHGVAHTVWGRDVGINPKGITTCQVFYDDFPMDWIELQISGDHNVANSLAAVATGFTLAIPLLDMIPALKRFTGMGRRFELKGVVDRTVIIDDYAHHPTEIEANLTAGKKRFSHGRLFAVWQPHTFSRIKQFYDKFLGAFTSADEVIVLDIYKSREKDDLGISAAQLALDINHPIVHHLPTFEETLAYLIPILRPGDAVIVMNAGDATHLATQLVTQLSDYRSAHPL